MEDGFLTIGLPVLCALVVISIVIAVLIWRARKEADIRERITALANNAAELTPEEFFELRAFSFGGRGRPQVSQKYNFAGVYILYNKTKNMYYVGQGGQVMNRVNNHFTGKGNGDVYADYKYGSEFVIRMIALDGSGFYTLNELEMNTIRVYDARATGYNKTRGNR